VGDTYTLTLEFESGLTMDVEITVESYTRRRMGNGAWTQPPPTGGMAGRHAAQAGGGAPPIVGPPAAVILTQKDLSQLIRLSRNGSPGPRTAHGRTRRPSRSS
jgi:hypothetical protein